MDTVAAISTGTDSNYNVIRISGPGVREMCSSLMRGLPENFFSKGYSSCRCSVKLHGNEVSCSIWFMKGPRSYTGEDCVEIHLDHVRSVTECLLGEIFNRGARLAKNGEFTQRAYLNGKISLTDAENIAEIIYSESPENLMALIGRKDSLFKELILNIKNILLDLLSDIEASIDFIEEDISFISSGEYIKKVCAIEEILITIRESTKTLTSRPAVMICGPSNAGKSTLFNCLLGRNRSVISAMEGTTRDIIKGELNICDMKVTLLDTPGFLQTPDDLNSKAIDMVISEIKKTPYIIYVFDSRQIDDCKLWLERFCFKPDIYVASKADLINGSPICKDGFIYVDSINGTGIQQLVDTLYQRITDNKSTSRSSIYITSRQFELIYKLNRCISNLKAMVDTVDKMCPELIADEIRQLLAYIAEITGKSVTDDVLSRIFSRFCVGK